MSTRQLDWVGINSPDCADWNGSLIFENAFEQCRPWLESVGTAPTLTMDKNGWPTNATGAQKATALLWNQSGAIHPTGPYVVTYKGKGTVTLLGDLKVDKVAPGRIEVHIDTPSDHGARVIVSDSDPTDYVRDIKVGLPGERRGRFSAKIMEQVKPFQVVRAMNFANTVNSTVSTWASRQQPDWYTKSMSSGGKGLSYEDIIAFSNVSGCAIWLCVPVQADDDHVSQLGAMIEANYKNKLIFVELTNEVWNDMFSAGKFLEEAGKKAGIALNPRLSYLGRRTKQIGQLLRAQMSDPTRLKMVLAGQLSVPNVLAVAAGFEDTAQYVDALSVACYGGNKGTSPKTATGGVKPTTFEDLVQQCESDFDRIAGYVTANKVIADKYKLPLIAYEGGPVFAPMGGWQGDPAFVEFLYQFHGSPECRKFYERLLKICVDAGISGYCGFNLIGQRKSQFGYWGHVQDNGDPKASPKWALLADLSAKVTGNFGREESIK